MRTWEQVDAFRAAAEASQVKAKSEWRAFAKIDVSLWGKLRFRGKSDDRRIKVEVPCFFAPRKWRASGGGYVDSLRLVQRAEEEVAMHGANALFTVERAKAVLVAWDMWVEKGCPRMTRPLVIP